MALSASHRPGSVLRRPIAVAATFAIAGLIVGAWIEAAHAQQFLSFPERRATQKSSSTSLLKKSRTPAQKGAPGQRRPANEQMLVNASEIHFDHANDQVSAVGSVQIYFSGSTIEADRVVYMRKTKRLRAEGNVRLTEADGRVTHGQVMDLSENFRDGFVDSLRMATPDQTRFAAQRADRSGGNVSVLQNGVYTACEECKTNPARPPLWQVKAARIIHDHGEKMIHFESARLEFFGAPVAYFPYFSTPDPTVKRKTGFLPPTNMMNSRLGLAVEIPYFWALAPDYDLTLSPMVTTRQGVMLQAEWRQRLESGSYFFRAAGIDQADKDRFVYSTGAPTPGHRDFRGMVESAGKFSLSDKWVWGWDTTVPTDKTFIQDYNMRRHRNATDPLRLTPTEGVSQLFIAGRGATSYFDARSIYYYGFSIADDQKRLPVIHPVVDYSYLFGRPVAGGELSYKVNMTSLSRETASFDAITAASSATGICGPLSADPAQKIPANCLLRGFPGTYSRFSTEVQWRRSITDSLGQVFTPFVSLRADAAAISVTNEPGVANYLPVGEDTIFRGMPTIGLEYRYPFISVQPWGTQTIEPIAQIIARPNETAIGRLPNEDAQSLIFDDTNLFRVNKFSGWDRVEGGGRANLGVQYTAQFTQAGNVNVLLGQSYHLFGGNSFASGDATNTGLGSGLESRQSDYIARLSYQPNRTYTFTSRFRFDESTLDVRRFELESRANFDRWAVTLLYGNYDRQPELGYLERREGVLGFSSYRIDANWLVRGGVRYDLRDNKIDQSQIGVGYIDDCLILALNYIRGYSYGTDAAVDHRVMFQLSLRTIGDTGTNQRVATGAGLGR